MNQGIAAGLYGDIEPKGNDVSGFWKSILGDDDDLIEDWDFAKGFVEGALKTWGAVDGDVAVRTVGL